MKTHFFFKSRTIFCTTAILLFFAISAFAQAPSKMSYQAVIRNSEDKLLNDKLITIRLSILQGAENGPVVYTETQKPVTNANGLLSIEYGGNAGFSQISWSDGTFFLKTEADPDGGSNFTISGITPILSVPYALHANKADALTEPFTESDPVFSSWDKDYNDLTNKPNIPDAADGSETKVQAGSNVTVSGKGTQSSPYIIGATGGGSGTGGDDGIKVGDMYGGGVVAWVNKAGTHGLILSAVDLSTAQAWSNIQSTEIGDAAQSYYDGMSNCNSIIAQVGHTMSAAKLCLDYTNANYGTGVFSDWYLPSIQEMKSFTTNLMDIQYALIYDNNPGTTAPSLDEYYWSSTETSGTYSWAYNFSDGDTGSYSYGNEKDWVIRVRAVRAF